MKKILLLLSTIFIVIGVCGCMRKDVSSSNAISYLKDKYGQDFSFVSQGNDVWSSKSKTSVYKDNEGRTFSVKRNGDDYTDNYCSILYDDEIQNHFNSSVGIKQKVFVSTEGEFFGNKGAFKDYRDYMKECSVLNLKMYISLEDNLDELANALLLVANNSTAFIVIYRVSDDVFNDLTHYNDLIKSSDIIQNESFWIRGNTVTSKSWG